MRFLRIPAAILGLLISALAFAQGTDRPRLALSIESQPLKTALRAFESQSGLQVSYREENVAIAGIMAPRVAGTLAAEEALKLLLSGTSLKFEFINPRLVRITSSTSADRVNAREVGVPEIQLAQVTPSLSEGEGQGKDEKQTVEGSKKSSTDTASETGIPEILVKGSKVLNMDIRRTQDDPQPYVIFDREAIDRSGANSIEELLKTRLTMNTLGVTTDQSAFVIGNASQVNLRGLGTGQTLILIDGHRTASLNSQGSPFQSDLNGMPLSAIERIEVLPTTAGGIYGGGATGGVVNIVLRRDYSGAELTLRYENTFHSDSAIPRVDLSAGISTEGGKTDILLAGSWSDNKGAFVQDREFLLDARAAISANNPNFFLPPAAPPLGRTANIRSSNGTPLFGPGSPSFTSVPVGYSGGGGLAPLQASAGRYNLDVAQTAQSGGGRHSLTGQPEISSIAATIRREFTPRLQAFVEGGLSKNRAFFALNQSPITFTIAASAPNNPFGQQIQVTTPSLGFDQLFDTTLKDQRVVAGVIFKVFQDWQIEADYTWQHRELLHLRGGRLAANGTTAVNNGTLDVLRDVAFSQSDLNAYLDTPLSVGPYDSMLKDATLRFSGPVATLPGGSVILSGLLEHNNEDFPEGLNPGGANPILFPSRSQTVNSAYVEFKLPIISATQNIPGAHELDLQLAARRDDYRVDGSTEFILLNAPIPIVRIRNETSSTNPTVALRYAPVPDVILRGSYGTGFLAPSVNQIAPGSPLTNVSGGFDPRRGNTTAGPYTYYQGGNPGLQPEESESWSVGLIFTPRWVNGLRASIDYANIHKTQNIRGNMNAQFVLDNEAFLPGRIQRSPLTAAEQALGYTGGPVTGIDITAINLSEAKVEAFDSSLDYRFETAATSVFEVFAVATWQTHYQTQIIPSQSFVENVGIGYSNPLKFKMNGGATWRRNRWSSGWLVRYFDSYDVSTNATVIANQGSRRVASQIYHDAFVSYRWGDSSRLGAGAKLLGAGEIQLGVKNLFDAKPPFDANFSPYLYSPFGDPRLASYYVSVKRHF